MIRINLLKPEKKDLKAEIAPTAKKVEEKKKPDLAKFILLFFVVLITALFFTQRKTLNKEKGLFQNAQQEKEKLQYVFSKLEELERLKSLYEKKINLIKLLKSEQKTPVTIMDGLSENIPPWVWLTQSTYGDNLIQIKGRALSNSSIADFISHLEKDPLFEDVNLIATIQRNIKNNKIHEFSLTARYVLIPKTEPQEETSEKESKGKRK